jgi:hypothetical protein
MYNLFHETRKSLDAEFHKTPQGDMTVHDTLGDIGVKASDETLVLTVIHGLNDLKGFAA